MFLKIIEWDTYISNIRIFGEMILIMNILVFIKISEVETEIPEI